MNMHTDDRHLKNIFKAQLTVHDSSVQVKWMNWERYHFECIFVTMNILCKLLWCTGRSLKCKLVMALIAASVPQWHGLLVAATFQHEVIKKILYNHLWKWCRTGSKNSDIYRGYHGGIHEWIKPDAKLIFSRIEADWSSCNVWFSVSQGYRKCASSFFESLFMRKATKAALVINGCWHWAWMSENRWGGVDSGKLSSAVIQLINDCDSAPSECCKGIDV